MPATEVASAGLIGYGTKIEIETVAGTLVYTELGEVKNANKPNATTAQVEVTHMGSPSRTQEFIAGLTDGGEIAMGMNWVPGAATDAFIEAWRAGGNERRSVRITSPAPGNKTYTFPGFILSYSASMQFGDVMEAELSLKVAGAVVRG